MANKELMVTLGLDASSYTQNVKRAKDLNKELDSSFDLLSSSSEKFEESIKGLGKKQEYLADKLKVAEGLSQVYADRMKETQEVIEDSSQSSEGYRKKIEKITSQMQKLEKENKTGTQAYKDLQKELEKNTQLLGKSDKTLATHKKRLLEAKIGYNETQASMQKMGREAQLVSMKLSAMKADEKIKQLNTEASKLDQRFDFVKKSVEGFDKTIVGLGRTQDHYNDKMKISEKLLTTYSTEMKKSSDTIDEYKKQLKGTEKELEKWTKEFKKMDATHPDYELYKQGVESLRKEYSDINKIMEFHNKRLEEMKKNYDKTDKELSTFAKNLNKTEKQMAKLKRQKLFDNLDNQIKTCSQEIRILESKFKLTESTMKKFAGTKAELNAKTELYKGKLVQLRSQLGHMNTSLTENTIHLNKLKEKQNEVQHASNILRLELRKMDKDSPEYDRTIIALARLENEFEELDREIRECTTRNNSLQAEINETTASVNNLQRSTNNLNREFRQTQWNKLGEGFQNAGQKIQQVGQAMLGVSMITGAVQTAIIKTGKDFQQSMSNVKAIMGNMGGTAEEQAKKFGELERAARDNAKVTTFTAKQSADALSYLALAGYDVNQAIGTLPNILSLAQAGAMDLALASDLATDSISSLGYIGNDAVAKMPEYLDKVAMTSTKANTSIEQMLQAYIKVGGQLDNMNVSLDTSAAMLGVLSNRGIKAEQAGTSLNSIMINFTKASGESAEALKKLGVSAFDANGDIKTMEQLMLELHKALQPLTKKDQVQLINMIGGKTQAKTLQKLMQGMIDDTGNLSEEYTKLKQNISEAPYIGLFEELSKKTNATEKELTSAYKQIQTTCESMNLGLETSGTMISLLADRGIKGAKAGETLNKVFSNLTQETGESAEALKKLGVSARDADGKVRPIEEIFIDLNKQLQKLPKKDQVNILNAIGGKDGITTLRALMSGMIDDTGNLSKEYTDLKNTIESDIDFGSLTQMSNVMTDNLSGDMAIFTSQLQESMLTIFDEIEPRLREWVQGLTEKLAQITDWFISLDDGTQNFILIMLSVMTVAAPFLMVLGSIANGLGAFFKGIGWVVGILPTFKIQVGEAEETVGILKKTMHELNKNLPKIQENLSKCGAVAKDAFKNVGSSASELSTATKGALQGVSASVGSWIGSLTPMITGWIAGLGTTIAGSGAWSAITSALTTVGSTIAAGIGAVFSATGAIIAGVVLAIAGVGYLLYKNWDEICQAMSKAWKLTCEGFKKTWEKVSKFFSDIGKNIGDAFSKGKELAIEAGGKIIAWFKELPSKIMAGLKALPGLIWNGIKYVCKTAFDLFGTLVGNSLAIVPVAFITLWDAIKNTFKSLTGVFDVLKGIFTLNFGMIADGAKKIFGGIYGIISGVLSSIWKFATGCLENIANVFGIDLSKIFETVEKWASDVWTSFTTLLGNLWTSITTWFSDTWSLFTTWLGDLWSNLCTWAANLYTGFTTWISDLWSNLCTWASDILTGLTTWLGDLWTSITTWFSDTWTGLTTWLGDLWSNLKQWTSNIWSGFKTWLKNIYSDFTTWCSDMFKKLKEWGKFFMEHPLQAMKQFAKAIFDSLASVFDKFKSWCSDMLSKLGSWFADLIKNTWSNLKEWAKKFSDATKEIFGYFKEIPSKLFNIGKDMINNLWNGFKSMLGNFKKNVTGAIDGILNKFKRSAPVQEVQANLNYNSSDLPSVAFAMDATSPMELTYGARNGFSNVGNIFNDMFADIFSLDNYRTSGGFYSPSSMSRVATPSGGSNNQGLIDALVQQNQLLMQLITSSTIQVGVNVDGRQIAKASARYMEDEINFIKNRKSRLGGF